MYAQKLPLWTKMCAWYLARVACHLPVPLLFGLCSGLLSGEGGAWLMSVKPDYCRHFPFLSSLFVPNMWNENAKSVKKDKCRTGCEIKHLDVVHINTYKHRQPKRVTYPLCARRSPCHPVRKHVTPRHFRPQGDTRVAGVCNWWSWSNPGLRWCNSDWQRIPSGLDHNSQTINLWAGVAATSHSTGEGWHGLTLSRLLYSLPRAQERPPFLSFFRGTKEEELALAAEKAGRVSIQFHSHW
jgi:hypothetical protein